MLIKVGPRGTRARHWKDYKRVSFNKWSHVRARRAPNTFSAITSQQKLEFGLLVGVEYFLLILTNFQVNPPGRCREKRFRTGRTDGQTAGQMNGLITYFSPMMLPLILRIRGLAIWDYFLGNLDGRLFQQGFNTGASMIAGGNRVCRRST